MTPLARNLLPQSPKCLILGYWERRFPKTERRWERSDLAAVFRDAVSGSAWCLATLPSWGLFRCMCCDKRQSSAYWRGVSGAARPQHTRGT